MNPSLHGRRVVITGGSGFIPSHLARRCLDDGARVAVTVRYGNVVKNERLRAWWDDLDIIEADLRNRGALEQVRQWKPDILFHLAAYNHVGQSFTQVEECFDVNAKGTANVLDTCGPVDRFVYMSTSEVYGHQTAVPFVEKMTPDPLSPYAITKYAGELYCRMKQRVAGSFPIVIVRPFNVFGPSQSSKAVIPELIDQCLRGIPVRTTRGEQTREFNYVTDIVDGLVRAALHPHPIEGPLNLATGVEVPIRDLVMLIAELTGTTSPIEIGALPYRPTEIWRMVADAGRARALLGWEPKVPLREGLSRTIEWFRSER
ncbi:MAG: GDP-mannose 4,6-dehydratase [Verrucomicrobiae bacterium]|nr:GDP-mannose 4,6-dehydratase [Verrucomicrobiae bacterium]